MSSELPFGQRVRERRRALDLTQEELANRVGCAAITIRKIEATAMRPSQQIAERLALALALALDERAAFVRHARAVRVDPAAETPRTLVSPPTAQEIGAEDLSGRAIRGYLLGERLGMGSFGAVYHAVQPLVDRPVAIKIILPQYADHPDFVRRFEHEARLVARLEHPHIVPLYDYWREPGVAYLVMRLLRGGSLHTRLAGGPLDSDLTLRVMAQVVGALSLAHRAGVVHRDIKPANILIDEEANAYLADFGIAKDLQRGEADTMAGAFIGSPAYSSPEQIRAEPVTPQTDIYALGILLFELCAGQRPFQSHSQADLIQQQLTGSVPTLATVRPGLPTMLDSVIQRATAKVPSARYPDVGELLADLRVALGAQTPGGITTHGRLTAAPVTIALDLDDSDTPYKGLRAFGEGDAGDFFGREALLQQLLARMGESGELARFLAVVGPSGSGKSSVVRAGLVPALRAGALPGSEQWYVADLLPGGDPYAALAAALWRMAPSGAEAEDLLALLRADARGLVRAARLVLPPDPAVELVLVIDQFEELFTLTSDEALRVQLLDSLVAAVLDERSRVRLIVTLRADFIDRPLRYVDAGELIKRRSELVLPLTPDELERTIVGPARRVGVGLEAGLVAALIAEVEGRPGALPLLQHALGELFLRRSGRALTRAAYQEIGGVAGALAGSAEACYSGLDPAGQTLARQLFLRLVLVGEGSEDTRRRVRRQELAGLGDEAALALALEAFGRARLLSFDHDAGTRAPTVEVTHEALLRSWPRLRGWIEAGREELLVQRRLATGAAEWEAAQRDASYLASGSRLAQLVALAEAGSVRLTSDERAYVAASQAAADAAAEQERERQAAALDLARGREAAQRSAAQRLRYLVAALGLFLIVALGLSSFAFQQRGVAQANLQRSEAQRLASESNRLLAEDGGADRIALLAIQSLRQEYSPQGDIALSGAASLLFPERVFRLPSGTAQDVAYAPNGAFVAVNGSDPQVQLWDVRSGALIKSFTKLSTKTAQSIAVAISPDSQQLAVAETDSTITLWRIATGEVVQQLRGHAGPVVNILFTPDGTQVLSVGFDQTAILWDVRSGEIAHQFPSPGSGSAIAIAPGGDTVLIGDGNEAVLCLSSRQPIRRLTGHTQPVQVVAYAPDGATALTASIDATIRLWEVATGREILKLAGHRDAVLGAAFSPDGRTVASSSTDLSIRIWDIQTGRELRRLLYQTGNLFDVQFSSDGTHLVSASYDGTAALWNLASPPGLRQFPAHERGVVSIAYAPRGDMIATSDGAGTLWLWSLSSSQPLHRMTGHRDVTNILSFSPDGRMLASGAFDGTVRVWDTQTGAELQRIDTPYPARSLQFVAEGRRLIIVGDPAFLLLWDLDRKEQVRSFALDSAGMDVSLAPDGRRVAVAEIDRKMIGVWDIETGERVRSYALPDGASLFSVLFAPDGRALLAGLDDGNIVMLDADTGSEVRRFIGHTDIPWDLDISPDGRLLLSSGLDNTARLWDLATGAEIRRIGHRGRIYSADFSPDGSLVLTGGLDGIAKLSYVSLTAAIDDLCGRLQRDFTADERVQFGIPAGEATCPQSR